MRNFDNETISIITAFENITGTEIRDCVYSETIYFLVNPGKIAMTIGKNGHNIKTAEKMLGKPIKVFEWSENSKELIKNMISKAKKIELKNGRAVVTISQEDRGAIIGRHGNNIKAIRELLTRNSDIKELKILP
ncbi:MAG: NusA-like transcription termination signal-binding factor [Candidatus Aenigmarchaeota archaeon]|nr:NusA-like transcription termination signal-binding factor [Candidatus Aenigmarchaeota archaeon]